MQNQNDEHSLIDFLKALYQYCKPDTFINLRFLPSAKNRFVPLSKLNTIPFIVNSHQNQNCYFGVATRRDGDGSKEGIDEISSLWCDVDIVKGSPAYDKFVRIYKDFPLKPSVLIKSGGGYHLYWLLKEPAPKKDIPSVEDLLKRIASHLGGDMAAAEAARILRVPGTYNLKHTPKRMVTIGHFHPEKQYNLDDFEILPPLPAKGREGRDQLHAPGWEQDLLKGVSDGERNISITRLAGRYIRKGLSGEEVIPILMDANSRFSPPLTLREIETILDSVIKTHQRNHPGDIPDLPIKIFSLPTLSDICDLDIKVEWVVEKLIPKQAVTVLHGKGGIGKTWLMLQLGSCVAEGTSLCGLATQRMPCYYIDFENSLATLHDRAVVLGRSSLQVWHISNPIPPSRLDSNEWVRYKELFPGLLIFDTLRASQLLDENSSKDMTTIMMRLKELRDMGFTIVLIHHTPKSDERTYKGSTAIQDQCDHVLSLDRVKSVGSEQEIDGDEEDWDHPLRLGVRGKTRYEPFSIYLQFDPSRGFEVAPDPDDDSLKKIHSLLIESKERKGVVANQSQIIILAKDQGINRKKSLRLLRKGEGRLWNPLPQPKSRAILYDPIPIIPLSPTIYIENNGTIDSKTGFVVSSDDKTLISEPVENTSFTHCSDAIKNKGTTESGVNLFEDYI